MWHLKTFTKSPEQTKNVPLQFCISDENSGIAAVFAVLPDWQPGKDLGVAILQPIEQADVCVRVSSLLQVPQVRPT